MALLVFLLGLPFDLGDKLPWVDERTRHAGGASEWIAEETARTAVDVAACFVVAALAAAIVRLVVGFTSRKLRLIDLWLYRWSLLFAGGAIAGGAAYASVRAKEHDWDGTIVFLILFGVISLAPLIAELAAGGSWTAQWVRDRRRHRARRGQVAGA
jgi:hypothetical protein